MEARVYNLAAHRQHLQVPYRFLPTARQGAHGDRAEDHELPEERRGKPTDIGDYFATRRADATVIDTMHRELQHAIRRPTRHVHLTTDIFMPDALHSAHQRVETLRQEGMTTPQFFVLQHRYSTEGVDRHFGAALLIFDPQMPDRPKRIVLCDTVNLPGWLPRFRQLVEHEFGPDAAGRIEVASHPLQGLNREPQACRHDLNCSFYTRSMARALLRLAQDKPHLLLSGETGQIHEAMKPLMKDYYANGLAKPPEEIRETNLYKRWNIGRSMLLGHSKLATRLEASEEQSWVSHVEQRMQDRELGIGLDAPLIAKR